MARNLFGGSSDDYAVDPTGRPIASRRVRFYTSAAMTTEITDLALDAAGTGSPLTVNTDSHGFWGPVYGPDGTTVMYAGTVDSGGNPPLYVVGIYTHTTAVGGVNSFNTRTGAVSLSKADVTGTGLAATDVGADAAGAATAAQTASLQKSSNLSDVVNAGTARTNLGLGTAATVNTGTTSGTVPLLSTGGVLPIARLATGTPDGTKFVRDDGTLASAASLTGGEAWLTGTTYTLGHEVVQAGVNYACAVAHTSGTFATDLAAGKWVETGINSASAVTLGTQTPSDPGTAAAGTLGFAAHVDHVHGSRGLYWWTGTGAHGDLVFDGTTTVVLPAIATQAGYGSVNLVPSSGVYTLTAEVYARNLTINAGVRVKVAGHLVHVQKTATINGTLDASGTNATAAAGGAGATSPQNSLSDGGNGGTGGTGVGPAGAAPARNLIGRARTISIGGAGGSSGATAGGAAGALSGLIGQDNFTTVQVLHPLVRVTGYYFAGTAGGNVGGSTGGGAGAGDGTNAGGGGGGGGGVLVLNTSSLAGAGVVSANGGNGAAGVAGNAGGGGGGGGGLVYLNTTDTTNWTGTVTATGGTAGAGSGTGNTGSVGSVGLPLLTVFS